MYYSSKFIKVYPKHVVLLLLTICIADGHLLTAITPVNYTTDSYTCNSAELNSKIDNLINIFTINMNKFKTELQNLVTNSTCDHESEIRAIISSINRNDIKNAVRSFLKINDNNHISRIINDSYANNVANFENILNFIRALPTLSQRGLAYTHLLTQMKSNNHLNNHEIITLGFWIKDISNFLKYPGVLTTELEQSKVLFENLKEALPKAVKMLLWEPFCLKNDYQKEYMFAENSMHAFRRKIFTLRGGNKAATGGRWKFESLDGKNFKLINDNYGEYLHISSDADSHDGSRRNVFTSKEDPIAQPSEWKLSVLNKDKNLIAIEENIRNEYLYAPIFVFDSEKRYVFTWRPYLATAPHDCIWEVVSC